jgi:glutamine---fructose-6-phosphate transaminase (isomerizing)
MNKILAEILEIPEKALLALNSESKKLPLNVPYLGMGSSYFAPLAFKYMGLEIQPEIASEYFNYLSSTEKKPLAVIISQSGKSTEALWCTSLFEKYIAISNYPENELSNKDNAIEKIAMNAGIENYSSSKTFVNTLILLFKGFGYDPTNTVQLLIKNINEYEAKGKKNAEEVFEILQTNKIHGIYITGSGPNLATAMEAALIMSESTNLNFHGLAMAQYDHGPKETAVNSIVIQIIAKGKAYDRAITLNKTIVAAGAHVFIVETPEVEEHFSILHNIVTFNFMAYYLSQKLGVTEMFAVGGKITEVI